MEQEKTYLYPLEEVKTRLQSVDTAQNLIDESLKQMALRRMGTDSFEPVPFHYKEALDTLFYTLNHLPNEVASVAISTEFPPV